MKNRIATSHLPDDPVPGCSPLELLEAGAFVATEKDFELLRPYLEHVVQVFCAT